MSRVALAACDQDMTSAKNTQDIRSLSRENSVYGEFEETKWRQFRKNEIMSQCDLKEREKQEKPYNILPAHLPVVSKPTPIFKTEKSPK